jgi:hypothetical protein
MKDRLSALAEDRDPCKRAGKSRGHWCHVLLGYSDAFGEDDHDQGVILGGEAMTSVTWRRPAHAAPRRG